MREKSWPLWSGFSILMLNLIFGATGFLGERLVERLVSNGDNILAVARNEGKLIALKEKFPSVEILTGDIADSWTVAFAMSRKPDNVFLLSAFKHVGMAEEQARQCTRSNVLGLMKVVEASLIYKPKQFIFISTDKAAQVAGVYGATKLLGERIMAEVERLNPDTKYRVVRYGNVLYSTGSVLCKWKDKMQKGEEVIITDETATRFFWTRDEAIDLIFECLEKAPDAKPWVPKMKAMSMGKILEAMMQKYGKVSVKKIGLQQGENAHETMDGKVFSNQVEQFTTEEIKEKI